MFDKKKILFFPFETLIEIMVTATLEGHVDFIMFLYFACTLSANFQVHIVAYWRCCIFSPNSKFMHFD